MVGKLLLAGHMDVLTQPSEQEELRDSCLAIVRENAGIQSWGHIDDILLWHNSKATLHAGLVTLFRTLHDAGFYIALAKSVLIPTQTINFLGFTINSRSHVFNCQIPFLHKLKDMLQSTPKSARAKHRLAGTLAFALYAMGLTSGYRFAARSVKGRRFLWRLLRSGPWPLPRPPDRLWACDATLQTIAAVDHRAHPLFIRSGTWNHIYLAELMALWATAKLAPVATAIFCDNMAVVGAMRRTRVKSFKLLETSWLVLHKNLKSGVY